MPEGLREWKRKEKSLYARMMAGFRAFFAGTGAFFRKTGKALSSRVSIVLLPQSEKPVRTFRPTVLAIAFVCVFVAAAAGFAIFATVRYGIATAKLASTESELREARRDLDSLRDGTEALAGAVMGFESGLSSALAAAGEAQSGVKGSASGASGAAGVTSSAGETALDAASSAGAALRVAGLEGILAPEASDGTAARELSRLEGLSAYLSDSAPSLERIATLLAGQKEIMTEIPNIWPVRGGAGHVSMYFGQNENPFSGGQWYLHNGIDISTFRTGDAVLATASGRVASLGYDPSLGTFVILQHSHGFYTRYGHLQSLKVKKGQLVGQGQVIAILGNSGKTTGPHLHYEVNLGTSVIDPLRFLNIRSAGSSASSAPSAAASSPASTSKGTGG